MTTPHPPSAEQLFYECLDIAESERAAYLGEKCGDDAALRAEVESLLKAHEKGKLVFDDPTVPTHEAPTMDSERFERLKEMLLEALERPSGERNAFLENTCGDDSDLLAEARRKLGRLAEDPGILKSVGIGAFLSMEGGGAAAALPHEGGSMIGPYRIIDRIGEGGMGVVYLAEQEQPIRRRVALKVIRLGMDTEDVIARFEAERQALAIMEHPNIARVFDAGATERGRPYFVMEYVDGIPITRYCDREKLPTASRLELFATTCRAIQHAHQRGIIHRDIKPSNVLVAEIGGERVVKVIDFGIAKATDPKSQERTFFTEKGQLVGTPEYMSPEQADTGVDDIDTTTDVYSLGVMLYELLTGLLPFDSKWLREQGWLEIQRVIRESEPPRPSTRISGVGNDAKTLAANRKTDLGSLLRELRGELDWVILKAMEKDRRRRYASASEFAEDVQRYLRREPVTARPPSAWYTLRKLASRYRAGFTVAGAIVILIVGFGAWVSVLYTRAEAARQDAVVARDEAESVTMFLTDMLSAVNPRKGDKDVTVRAVLDEAAESVQGEFENAPIVRSRVLATIGGVYTELGGYDEARPLHEEALRITEEHLGSDHPTTAARIANFGKFLTKTGDYENGAAEFERAIAIQQSALPPDHPDLVSSLQDLAVLKRLAGDFPRSMDLFEQVLELQEARFGPDHLEVAEAAINLSTVLGNLGETKRRRELIERALVIQEREFDPGHPDLANAKENLAIAYSDDGEYQRARELHESAISILEQALSPDHPDVALSLSNLALTLGKLEEYEEAVRTSKRALAIQEKTLGPNHPALGAMSLNHSEYIASTGDYDEAFTYAERARTIFTNALPPGHPFHGFGLANLAVLHRDTGDYAMSERLFQEAIPILEGALPPDHPNLVGYKREFAELYRRMGEGEKAAAIEAGLPAEAGD